jgi:hypothetical protein
MVKKLEDLTIHDLEECPVWKFVQEEEVSGNFIFVRPICELPISDARQHIIGSKVIFNCGASCWALLGNLDLRNARSTRHFLTVSFNCDGNWFDLARYHDVDYSRRGPEQLAGFLGRSISDIFPITYDISASAHGLPEVVRGTIPAKINDKLSRGELIALSLEP